jgi:hypothetical protein
MIGGEPSTMANAGTAFPSASFETKSMGVMSGTS